MSIRQTLANAVAEAARLEILKALAAQADGRLTDLLLQRTLDAYGYRRDRDWVRTQLAKLEALSAVSLDEAGTVTIARIERAGRDHVEERAVLSGVQRPHEAE